MKFKLTNAEMIALTALLFEVMKTHLNDSSVESQLYTALHQELYVQLKIKSFLRKEKYSFKMSPAQAIAFWMWFNDLLPASSQAGNFTQQMCNAIHRDILMKEMQPVQTLML